MLTFKNKEKLMQRGSLMVDAACSFPVFVMVLCLMAGLLPHAGKEEMTVYTMAQTAVSAEKNISADILPESGYRHIKSSVPFSGLFTGFLLKDYGSTKAMLYRPFTGASSGSGTEGGIVFVFPKRGECYHHAGCSCLKNGTSAAVLNQPLRKKYKACQLCHPDSLPDGACVSLYSSDSRTYHRQSCAVIKKTYESISLSQAQALGYKPCMLCCGPEADDDE